MMVQERSRPQTALNTDNPRFSQEAGCIYALITNQRSVSRRNRASWYLRQLNKVVKCDSIVESDSEESSESNPADDKNTGTSPIQETIKKRDIDLVSITGVTNPSETSQELLSDLEDGDEQQFMLTPNTRVLFLSRSIATSIVLDLSPSVVSVSPQNDCILLDSMFDALKRVLHLLVNEQEIPSHQKSEPFGFKPKVFISVIAYTPFVVAKNNQVLVQNRRISSANIEQVLVELWISLTRLTQEIHELVSFTYVSNLDFGSSQSNTNMLLSLQRVNEGVIRHPGLVLEDIYELGLFSSSLMPRLSRLSLVVITDGLFSSTNNLSMFRLKSIAVSFVSLGIEAAYPDACFGYAPYIDLMKFVAKTTMGVYLSHQDLMETSYSWSKAKRIPLTNNPLYKLFSWTMQSEFGDDIFCDTPKATNFCQSNHNEMKLNELDSSNITRFFCFDQPLEHSKQSPQSDLSSSLVRHNYHDWRSFRQLERNLDADFEHVLSCLLREGYLIKHIQFKHKETTKIIARLVLHWRHNLDLEQELTAPYWSSTDPFEITGNNQLILRPLNTPLYGDTYCEVIVLGSYSFLHTLYCEKKPHKRKSEYRELAYRQFRQLIDGVLQTHERLQYLSRFYRDSSLSKVPSFLSHGNSLLYEQPHTRRLTSTIENVMDERETNDFQEYWQKISCLDTKSWKNLMHIHTLRLVLEHDQPKHKNIHCQNANGRYTHVQCRRALSAISCFIKSYASFALLEDTTYVKFIYNNDDDLREIETSATKGFIVIRINKLLPIIVIYLMFTSGILDSHRVQIVSYLEDQLTNCKLRNTKTSSSNIQMENILKSKTISSSGESCCALIRSPLERMLKVYSRSFVTDFLMNNWSHGLPGSCPYTMQQSLKVIGPNHNDAYPPQKQKPTAVKDNVDGYNPDNSLTRYNLIFGKYLYGVRVIQTMSGLPHDIVPSLAANVLSKISAILVNLRIKQGFYIAFNNSGILNLVVELDMKDYSNEDHASSCLCQYIVFPPTVTNCPQTIHTILNTHQSGVTSKPCSLSGSLANSDSYMKNAPDSVQHVRVDDGEIKIIKEYWIEQQYGISSESTKYHCSLEQKRYSEIVDHLFKTDTAIFECLLTYDLLQLLCDKLSLYYDLDLSFSGNDSTLVCSPTSSTSSPNQVNQETDHPVKQTLPSSFIDGITKDGTSKVPLIELEYRFSVVRFLDFCQQASLNILLFKDGSEYHDSAQLELERNIKRKMNADLGHLCDQQISSSNQSNYLRKMSVDVNDVEIDLNRREHHRSSYQNENPPTGSYTYFSSLYSVSLNHMFLETLHKRLKQMHDKELKLTDQDQAELPLYLKNRILSNRVELESKLDVKLDSKVETNSQLNNVKLSDLDKSDQKEVESDKSIDWRCFLRKGNQENLMIVIVPSTLNDVTNWLNFTHSSSTSESHWRLNRVCPIFVFRCSGSMINDHVMSFLKSENLPKPAKLSLESDIMLHFGQPCQYMGQLITSNCELDTDILPTNHHGILNPNTSDEKTLEAVHFRLFLRKIKNTVLKSRFHSLTDAYLSELFIHKDDILYYLNNVDSDTQKKYHVSSQLKSLAEFIKSYEEYNDSLPKDPGKPCNPLLNSILLQKCGLFINQPIARFNESSPLVRQMHDKKLLFLMRSNYKIELPLLEENLAGSTLLRKYIKSASAASSAPSNMNQPMSSTHIPLSSSISEAKTVVNNTASSSLSKSEGTRLMELKCGTSDLLSNSPNVIYSTTDKSKIHQAPRFSSNSNISSLPSSSSDNYILEVFRDSKSCSMEEVPLSDTYDANDISLRHEAHMAEVLRRTSERKESHQYRRVLKSKGNYNQSHGAIDQALRRVDSLGRFEHFCLTPLLFSPSWRSKLAPVRDHTIESARLEDIENHYEGSMNGAGCEDELEFQQDGSMEASGFVSTGTSAQLRQTRTTQQMNENRWYQTVCNNYIKEYEQYIQTLGFNSVQIKYQSSSKSNSSTATTTTNQSPLNSSSKTSIKRRSRNSSLTNSRLPITKNASSSQNTSSSLVRQNSNFITGSSLANSSSYNTGYLIKFLNSGCLVFKVGFCKPYVYSILYSIEGERFNNSNTKVNMTTFLDELDNIKVTMHLHSFTYDYHLRTMYSYISGRQLTFSPGYHLISFLDEFRKYYQKAPNYARNHILSGEISVTNTKVGGQQLYNYIVTHNSAYNMQVLEMSSSISNLISGFSGRDCLIEDQKSQETSSGKESLTQDSMNLTRNHANDYVLIELKREKVYYRDGKDPDIFDCGLLITHDIHNSSQLNENSLTLKYFLLLTNQRDLYPKLIHTYDSIISFGCHRPIRLGVAEQKPNPRKQSVHKVSSTTAPSSGQSDVDDIPSSELQSSGEMSGPASILSTANSVQSSSSGLQIGPHIGGQTSEKISLGTTSDKSSSSAAAASGQTSTSLIPKIKLEESEETKYEENTTSGVEASGCTAGGLEVASARQSSDTSQHATSSMEEEENDSCSSGQASSSSSSKKRNKRKHNNYNSSPNSEQNNKRNTAQERTICDEEITYLGYFSSDEMDMLKFLQEKTANLRAHIEEVVRLAEVHYQRDYLWHKLMQRHHTTLAANKLDELPLTNDELTQLLAIVEAVDLSTLDPQLSTFLSMHTNWYMKLLKSFADLKQSSMNQHRIYTLKTLSRFLLLYIDPKCTTAFILFSFDPERGSVELNLQFKDKQDCVNGQQQSSSSSTSKSLDEPSSTTTALTMDLDQDCQQLINDFVNFCACFMWSTFFN